MGKYVSEKPAIGIRPIVDGRVPESAACAEFAIKR